MSFCSSVLMCHAPIVIPEVAKAQAKACQRTTLAMRRMAQRLVRERPDALLVISPHAPRQPTSWGLLFDDIVAGDFQRFGAPEVSVELRGAPAVARLVAETADSLGVEYNRLETGPLDHGSSVPLHFVQSQGWAGPTLVIALPALGHVSRQRFGQVLARAARTAGQRWALLASGDMSHRLKPGAPAGFHPRAAQFDREVVELLSRAELRGVSQLAPELRELAAEDVIDSLEVVAAATDYAAAGVYVDTYEGPFGVGYCEAVLFDPHAAPTGLLDVARRALGAYLSETPWQPPRLEAPWSEPRGVFVTLRERRSGKLRGCVGRLEPSQASLAEEIANAAVSAGINDPRFPRVSPEELDDLSFEVSVLSDFESVTDIAAELDPSRYGIVVSGAGRQGVLLPNIPGVRDVAQQLRIAKDKAQLSDAATVQVQRFRVRKAVEHPAPFHA